MISPRVTRSQTKNFSAANSDQHSNDSRASSRNGNGSNNKAQPVKEEQAITINQFVENKVQEHKARKQIRSRQSELLEARSSISGREGKSESSKGAGVTISTKSKEIVKQRDENISMRPPTSKGDRIPSPTTEALVLRNEAAIHCSGRDHRTRCSENHGNPSTSAPTKRVRQINKSGDTGKEKPSKQASTKKSSYYDGRLKNVCRAESSVEESEKSDSDNSNS